MLHLHKPSSSAWVGQTTTPDAHNFIHTTWFAHKLWQIMVRRFNFSPIFCQNYPNIIINSRIHHWPAPPLAIGPTRQNKTQRQWLNWFAIERTQSVKQFGAKWNRKWSQRELNWLWWKVCWPDTYTPATLCLIGPKNVRLWYSNARFGVQ